MTDEHEKTRKAPKATRVQIYRINKLLDEHCSRITGSMDEPGMCKYAEGWDDNRVAELVGCSHHSVAAIRKDIFGQLFSTKNNQVAQQMPDLGGLLSRMASTERRLGEKCEALRQLVSSFNALCVKLGEPDLKVQLHNGEYNADT